MVKVLLIGLWVCVVTLLSSYGGAYWVAGTAAKQEDEPYLAGLEYRRLDAINVPMILDGGVRGYVVLKLVYTADAGTLRQITVDPQVFVINAAFDEIYMNGRVEFGKLSKYNLADMLASIKKRANEKLNGDVVQEVLVDSVNYIDKSEIRALVDRSGSKPKAGPKTTSNGKAEPATH
ncbi:hypothetical protein [Ancylobacter radicis]|uniref:Flagellar basal body-associated protein FliL n=1 Tax=Ancylobacter radicis TaxID=2836179 RepID=A0ABS5RC92_9HYPH|nr:hypothetical protein [Ancylobacter radicis]MBS9479290.1 hypothetical protein [Ancylobacter radicis]